MKIMLYLCIVKLNTHHMEKHEKIGIMGLGQINSCTTRKEVEKISVKPKPIEKIIKEEEVFKITGLHRFDDLDYKTLLRYERGVIPPNFYNKRKKK